MPTNRTRRRRAPEPEVSVNVRRFLETGDHGRGGLAVFRLWSPTSAGRERLRAAWEACRQEILRDWTKAHPATRPWAWWVCDAPQEPIPGCPEMRAAQRRRLGGTGTPSHEVLALVPHFAFGLPVAFVDAWSVAYYNGRARDIHGTPVGTEHQGSDFAGVAIDPADSPQFEAEAAYLERHGLLTATERRWVEAHPEALEPERVALPGEVVPQ